MANVNPLIPPLLHQVSLSQAIRDHGKFMIEAVSYTGFVQNPFRVCFLFF